MVRVKVCGITDIEDAEHAAKCGADEIGLNFYPKSPRYIALSTAASIAERLSGSVTLVGVFVNADEGEIAAAVKQCGLDAVQLHGDESIEFARKTAHANGVRVIKAAEAKAAIRVLEEVRECGLSLLVDAPAMGAYGGTGSVSDWNLAAKAAAEFEPSFISRAPRT